ncbi:hypothetical protein DUNSADRAFT_8723 [Dunaliella salina]|uniref:Encoded protein n=1 Tax=Dunaliella salina TaxID=3046 RepID=A0ABQ7GIW4_DUNSA|nr:hypothetical protein DUNSADRAFT_8723 [Dunaliella salina]|eukprot:KAF5834556.1 hypothetical protein DUNSADRAFT_8723 [Dunaliella salina]
MECADYCELKTYTLQFTCLCKHMCKEASNRSRLAWQKSAAQLPSLTIPAMNYNLVMHARIAVYSNPCI